MAAGEGGRNVAYDIGHGYSLCVEARTRAGQYEAGIEGRGRGMVTVEGMQEFDDCLFERLLLVVSLS